MNKNVFEIICERVLENEKINKFKSDSSRKNILKLESDNVAYEIIYNAENKRVVLKGVSGESDKVLSSWLLDEESASQKDIQMIVDDFTEVIFGNPKSVFKTPKKRASQDESNITGLFFANRMVNIFPDIKDLIRIEKECYSEFRIVKFTREVINPRINKLFSNYKNNIPTVKKLGKLLSDLYSNATLDVRSVITMCILNNIENASLLDEFLSEELRKAKEHALKYKGKKVKPENPKKKSSLFSKALEYQKQAENQK